MSKKKSKDNYILFCGNNSVDVTGSCIYIQFENKKMLLEAGMAQSSDYLESYKFSTVKFKFKPSEIDYVFIGHTHVDHVGLCPRLVKQGFKGKFIMSSETALLIKPLLINCAYILQSEANTLSKKYGRNYEPAYTEDDVYKTLEYICTYDKNNYQYVLDDIVSFEWLSNSHCVGAKQLVLTLTNSLGVSESILYTSDIGRLKNNNHYLKNTEICQKSVKYAIMESTYGTGARDTRKTREFDVEHLRVAINTVLERGGICMMPCFSFSRTQEMLTTIYELYHDADFPYDVVVDSMLSVDICKLYKEILKGDDLELWEDVCDWKNVKFITDKETSLSCVKDHTPKVVISSSGFCLQGRILSYLHEYLKDINSMVIFSGFTGSDNSYLSYRIKNYKENKKIKISGDIVANNADCISLTTFSSHANQKDLIEIGSSLNVQQKIVLVHGEPEAKNCLKEKLQEEISKKDKNFKVVAATKDMVLYL